MYKQTHGICEPRRGRAVEREKFLSSLFSRVAFMGKKEEAYCVYKFESPPPAVYSLVQVHVWVREREREREKEDCVGQTHRIYDSIASAGSSSRSPHHSSWTFSLTSPC